MENEIKFSEFLSEGRQLEDCNLKTFVALFVNHRPVYGIGKKNIEEAINVLTDKKDFVKGELSNGMWSYSNLIIRGIYKSFEN